MLAFPILRFLNSVYYYQSMKDKYPIFYIISSCLSQHSNLLIHTSKRRKKNTTLCARFSHEKTIIDKISYKGY